LRKSGSLTLREYLFSVIYEPINRSREKQVSRFAELITLQNNPDKERFLQRTGCVPSKIEIIPGNIGLPRCTPQWKNKNKSNSVNKLLYIGSLDPSKGLWDLLKALALLVKKGYSSLSCCVLGRLENTKPVFDLIKDLGIERNITTEGFKDPFPYLEDCDLMIYPTLYDAFPDAVLEALHVGCPVMASAVCGVPDILYYPELLFESGNVGEIAEKIERCVNDNSYYKNIRTLCAERAQEYYFDWAERFETAMKNHDPHYHSIP
jgi:glycosyltransferase involved in cell wall biosynthesis